MVVRQPKRYHQLEPAATTRAGGEVKGEGGVTRVLELDLPEWGVDHRETPDCFLEARTTKET